jgi:hypothetical protein
MLKQILNYLRYSGCNITLKLNPYHWRFNIEYFKTNECWEQDALVIELLPITIRFWLDDGSW